MPYFKQGSFALISPNVIFSVNSMRARIMVKQANKQCHAPSGQQMPASSLALESELQFVGQFNSSIPFSAPNAVPAQPTFPPARQVPSQPGASRGFRQPNMPMYRVMPSTGAVRMVYRPYPQPRLVRPVTSGVHGGGVVGMSAVRVPFSMSSVSSSGSALETSGIRGVHRFSNPMVSGFNPLPTKRRRSRRSQRVQPPNPQFLPRQGSAGFGPRFFAIVPPRHGNVNGGMPRFRGSL